MFKANRRKFLFAIPLILSGFLFFITSVNSNAQTAQSDANAPSPRRISPEAAYQMMSQSDNFVLLDVRSPAEFRRGHITGAILIPHTELASRAARELPDKNAPIFVYCQAGVRSANAAGTLAGLGYTRVFDTGGIVDWPARLRQ